MAGWLALGGIVFAAVAFFGVLFAFVVLALKAAFWLILLPFRLIGWAIGAVFAVAGVMLAIVGGLALLLAPLLPLAILAGLVYGVYRLVRRPALA